MAESLRVPGRSWSPALRRRFIASLARCGQVGLAAAVCGLSRQSVYKLRERDAAFAAEWDAAVAESHGGREREGLAELARLIEERRAVRPIDPRFLDLLRQVAGQGFSAAEGARVSFPRTPSLS